MWKLHSSLAWRMARDFSSRSGRGPSQGAAEEGTPLGMLPIRTSLATQWLRLCTSSAKDTGLIPGQGTKIPHAMWRSQKKTSCHHDPPSLSFPVLGLSASPFWESQMAGLHTKNWQDALKENKTIDIWCSHLCPMLMDHQAHDTSQVAQW